MTQQPDEMPFSVFIETTIPSYCVARPSREPLQFARQEITRRWWERERGRYQLFTSQAVLQEAAQGEKAKASERLRLLAGIPLLDLDQQVENLAARLLRDGILPAMADRDAVHLAAAGVHRMDFLLTWNCKHIANPFIAERLRSCFLESGIYLPVICTPEQFFTNDEEVQDPTPSDGR